VLGQEQVDRHARLLEHREGVGAGRPAEWDDAAREPGHGPGVWPGVDVDDTGPGVRVDPYQELAEPVDHRRLPVLDPQLPGELRGPLVSD
jgi:hypothetical protein